MKIKSDKQTESERFDDAMDALLSVPHEKVKKALDEEKEKKKKRKRSRDK